MNYASNIRAGFHATRDLVAVRPSAASKFKVRSEYTYRFENFFHPYVGEIIEKLNQEGIKGALHPKFTGGLREEFFISTYSPAFDTTSRTRSFAKEIDFEPGGPYSNYNWEFFFHIPLAIAVHLSKNQRFAEAQRWFHLIFDPTANDAAAPNENPHWRFLAFRRADGTMQIDEMLALLAKPAAECDSEELDLKARLIEALDDMRKHPFRPHVIARTRPLAYMYHVVMKYLDNLIAWGDHLFLQDTMESINECTQVYVLAANILGVRPQEIPAQGKVRAKSFAQLRAAGLDEMGNALVELEGQFPFNLSGIAASTPQAASAPLLGIGRTLYFCIPRNDRLLSYWDTVADRLFKVRNCMNMAGVVRPLALFDPPIDPALLVKAVAAGIDIGAAVAGIQQPAGPLRAPVMIRKALELCAEVRSLGAALLQAIEKGDAERLSQLRQRHEIKIQSMQEEARLLQWRGAERATETLVATRAATLERYKFYLGALGRETDTKFAPATLMLDRRLLTAENFDEAYAALVGIYDGEPPKIDYPKRSISGESTPAGSASALGISVTEADEMSNMGTARDLSLAASIVEAAGVATAFIPDAKGNLHYWGIGATIDMRVGTGISKGIEVASKILKMTGDWHREQAGIHQRSAGHQRRAEEWTLQASTGAKELRAIGRQILGSLIAEQVVRHEKEISAQQVAHSNEVDHLLRDKFSSAELYGWMQGELSRLYYEYYRFAFDLARRAEQTMKRELMRPELDAQNIVRFDYWDGGRKGLLAGETLYLDLQRMASAYDEYNQPEYELTKNVSLLQLDPLALVQLRASGRCQVRLPESMFDLDGPGHFFRRIQSVAVSVPSVTGPYVSVNCKLMLLRSTIRVSHLAADGYARTDSEDTRFVDLPGGGQAVVMSTAQHDTGRFDGFTRDDRYLPFENAGAVSEWQISLPANPARGEPTTFDYRTIADVVLHVRYTAREGGEALAKAAFGDFVTPDEPQPSVRLFSLRHEFPSEWAAFTATPATGKRPVLKLALRSEHFPYWSKGRIGEISKVELFAEQPPGAPTNVQVFDRADLSDNQANVDSIRSDPALRLATGRLQKIALPAVPTDEEPVMLTLAFDKAEFADIWLAVSWMPG